MVSATMIVARLNFAARTIGGFVAALVVARLTVPTATIVTWLTLACGGGTGLAALVVARFVMSATTVVTRLTLACGGGGGVAAMLAFAMTTPVIPSAAEA